MSLKQKLFTSFLFGIAVVLSVRVLWPCRPWQLCFWMKTCLMDHVCVLGPSSSNTGKWRTVAECAGTRRPRYTHTLSPHTHTHTHNKTHKPQCVLFSRVSPSAEVHVGESGSGFGWAMARGCGTHAAAGSGGRGQCGALRSNIRGHLYLPLASGTQGRTVRAACVV